MLSPNYNEIIEPIPSNISSLELKILKKTQMSKKKKRKKLIKTLIDFKWAIEYCQENDIQISLNFKLFSLHFLNSN